MKGVTYVFFPGETISHGFVIPFLPQDIDRVIVSYKQNDDIVFEKTVTEGFEQLGSEKSYFSFAFTQTEGLCFLDDTKFTIQCNVYTKGGTRHTSRIMKGSTGKQYYREVIANA